jgi:UPF0271 protein
MVRDRHVETVDGAIVPLEIDTLCVHGDTPGGDRLAAALREGLKLAGIQLVAAGLLTNH